MLSQKKLKYIYVVGQVLFANKQYVQLRTFTVHRQLSYIAEHMSNIQHLAGQQNVVADALSWPTQQLMESPPTSPSWDCRGDRQK
jgi:hypothetical protein